MHTEEECFLVLSHNERPSGLSDRRDIAKFELRTCERARAKIPSPNRSIHVSYPELVRFYKCVEVNAQELKCDAL